MVYSSEINLKLNLWEDYVSPVVVALWLLFSSESLFQPNNTSRLELFSQPNELSVFENKMAFILGVRRKTARQPHGGFAANFLFFI